MDKCGWLLTAEIRWQPESTKTRNLKSPRFSVANVPVASQIPVGRFFFEQSQREPQSLAIFCRKGKSQGFLGAQQIAAFFAPASQKIATAIAEKKSRHSVHSAGNSKAMDTMLTGLHVVLKHVVFAAFNQASDMLPPTSQFRVFSRAVFLLSEPPWKKSTLTLQSNNRLSIIFWREKN